jgi:hypothetical protein
MFLPRLLDSPLLLDCPDPGRHRSPPLGPLGPQRPTNQPSREWQGSARNGVEVEMRKKKSPSGAVGLSGPVIGQPRRKRCQGTRVTGPVGTRMRPRSDNRRLCRKPQLNLTSPADGPRDSSRIEWTWELHGRPRLFPFSLARSPDNCPSAAGGALPLCCRELVPFGGGARHRRP